MKTRVLLGLLLLAFLAACSAPRTAVKTDDQSGSLVLKVVPNSAQVIVNGEPMGKAREFDGTSSVMKLAPGTHSIVLKAEGYEDHETKVYVSDTEEIIQVQLRKVP